MAQLNTDIALAYLYARKPNYHVEEYKAAMDLQDAHLERLRKGENIFNVAEAVDGGLPDVTFPTVQQVENLQLIRDRARGYYPTRVNQLLPG